VVLDVLGGVFLADSTKLNSEIGQILDRTDTKFQPVGTDGVRELALPPGGVAVSNPSAFASYVMGGSQRAFTSFIDPNRLKLIPQSKTSAQANATAKSGMYLWKLRVDGSETDPKYEIGLNWPGQHWDVIPGIITLSEPGIVLAYDRAKPEAEALSGTLFGGVTLGAGFDLDAYLMMSRNDGASLHASLRKGHVGRVGDLLGIFGLDGLLGVSDLTVSELDIVAQTNNDISMQFMLAGSWRPGWGKGSFELDDVEFYVARKNGEIEAEVGATARIGKTDWHVKAAHGGGDWIFGINADFGDEGGLAHVFDQLAHLFGLSNPLLGQDAFGTLSVTHVGIEMGLASHDITVVIETGNSWVVPWCEGLTLSGLMLDVQHTGGDDGGTSIDMTGDMHFGGQDAPKFKLEAKHEGHEDGWTFSAKLPELKEGETRTLKDLPLPGGMEISGSDFPLDTSQLSIKQMEMSFNTAKKDMKLSLKGGLNSKPDLDFAIEVELKPLLNPLPDGPKFEKHFSGSVTLGADKDDPDKGMRFDLIFDKGKSQTFVAAYKNHAGAKISVKSLIAGIVDSSEGVPDLNFRLNDAVLVAAKSKPAQGKNLNDEKYAFLLSMDIDVGADLSQLPLVSTVLPADKSIKLGFKPTHASRAFEAEELTELRKLLPPGAATLGSLPEPGEKEAPGIAPGTHLNTHLQIGGFSLDMPLMVQGDEHAPVGDEGNSEIKADTTKGVQQPESDDIHWIDVQKKLGPLSFDRLGLGFDITEMNVKARIDASITAGGLTLSAMGLGADYHIRKDSVFYKEHHRHLDFHLDGLNLAYESGPTAISGAFLKIGEGDFVGEALIRTASFGLSALGGYTDQADYKSLFVYAFLDYPIGGPPFCFVEGAALGFGYNREVRDVAVTEVKNFPFVAQALATGDHSPPTPPADPQAVQEALMGQMRELGDWIQPKDGEHFLAVGMKFNTFRIVDSFALAIISFGDRFRLDVLGSSTAVLPPTAPDAPKDDKTPKLAVIDMAFKARYDPEESYLGLRADLSKASWVLSKDCHLSGQFAFSTWYGGPHSGDFVTTLGGYYPGFNVPDHYPRANRLELKWNVSDQVQIKGNCYFALTPNAMMAGGHFEASWHCGNLWASYAAGADFLIQYKPFHYEAGISIEVSAGYGALSGSLGASIDMQGPEFSGVAHFKFMFVSFDVHFGASDHTRPCIPWDEFRNSFLPADDHKIVSANVSGGVIRSITHQDKTQTWVTNPKEFALTTSSLIPFSKMALGVGETGECAMSLDDPGPSTAFGIAPMNVKQVTKSLHRVRIKRDGNEADEQFTITPRTKAYAAAMWGVSGTTPDLKSDAVVQLPGELHILPRKPVVAGQTTSIPRRNLAFDLREVVIEKAVEFGKKVTDPKGTEYVWPKNAKTTPKPDLAEALLSESAIKARAAVIDYLDLREDNRILLDAGAVDGLILRPHIAEHAFGDAS
jgi:hypothetical protein